MSNLLTYSGIVTKVKGMESNCIKPKDYESISTIESVIEYIQYLKQHQGYKSIFHNTDEYTVHRGEIEGVFILSLYSDFAKIYRFANIEQRKALDLVFFRYEVNILKVCIQLLYSKKGYYNLAMFEPFFKHHSKINIQSLIQARSIEEFVSNLKDTQYHSLFLRLMNTNHNTPFDFEMQLDIYYFKKAWKLKDKLLTGDNLKAFTKVLGTEIDLLNIMWLYRSKRYFDTNTSNYYGYIISVNYKLDKQKLTKLLESTSIDEFIQILKTTAYKDLANAFLDGDIENKVNKVIAKVYRDNSAKYSASMAYVFHYLYHKRDEINRLTTALECIRYKLEPSDTLHYILQS